MICKQIISKNHLLSSKFYKFINSYSNIKKTFKSLFNRSDKKYLNIDIKYHFT